MSSIGSLTEPLFVNLFLRKFVHSLPSYLGDTTDVLNTLKDWKCEPNYILASKVLSKIDIQSLYTCIPHHIGVQAMSYYLERRPTDILPPSAFLLSLVEIILSHNFFKYNGNFYLQLQGTARRIVAQFQTLKTKQ